MTGPDPGERSPRPPDDPGLDRPLLLGFAIVVILGLSAATQFVAWWFGFSRHLGAPLVVSATATVWRLRAGALVAVAAGFGVLRVASLQRFAGLTWLAALALGLASGTRVYPPYQVLVWYHQSGAYGRGEGALLFGTAWAMIMVVAVFGCAAVARARRRPRRARSETHGSAHWGSTAALERPDGLLLGRHGERLLRVPGEGHLLTVAPTRAGKGVGTVIPNLLDHPGSALVTDPKGENYAVTSAWRQNHGNEVMAFDPFGVVEEQRRRCYNPLALIDFDRTDALDDARLLADMLVLTEGPGALHATEAFWNEEARALLTGLILYAAASKDPKERTLIHVRRLLTLPPEGFTNLLRDMQASQAARYLVASAAARHLQKSDRERSGVVSTAQSHTHFLDSPAMATVLGDEGLPCGDLAALKAGKASVYLILPTNRLDGYARWLRLMIAFALVAMARTPGQPQTQVLFLLDEFAHLGRMQPVERDIGLAGAYGVRFWLIVQNLAQLRSTYAESWLNFLANANVLQAFGINDLDTADYLSRMAGEATVSVESEQASRGVSRGRHGQRQLGASLTRTETRRRLMFADEIRRLPGERELLFVKGCAPLVVERLNYLRDPEFQGRADQNPHYAGVAGSNAAVASPTRSGPLAWLQAVLARIRPWLPPSSITHADGTGESRSAPPPVAPSQGGENPDTPPEG